MYGAAYGWPRQSWRSDPAPVASALIRPYDQQPGIFQRGLKITGNSTDNRTDSSLDPSVVCPVAHDAQDDGPLYVDADFDYDSQLFVDMDGNPIDGRSCSVIYDDRDQDHEVRIMVDEDGNVVDMYMGGGDDNDASLSSGEDASESSVTATAEPAIATVMTEAASPGSSLFSQTLPARTTVIATRSGSLVTLAPF